MKGTHPRTDPAARKVPDGQLPAETPVRQHLHRAQGDAPRELIREVQPQPDDAAALDPEASAAADIIGIQRDGVPLAVTDEGRQIDLLAVVVFGFGFGREENLSGGRGSETLGAVFDGL